MTPEQEELLAKMRVAVREAAKAPFTRKQDVSPVPSDWKPRKKRGPRLYGYHFWTAEEDAALIAGRSQGRKFVELEIQLGRTHGQIAGRIFRLRKKGLL